VLWARTPAAVEPVAALPVPRVSIHLVVRDGDKPSAFGGRLAAAGYRVNNIEGSGFAAFEAAEAEEEPEQQDEIALLVIDERGDPVAEAAEWIAFAARLATVSARRGMPLWLVTRGAQHADPTGDPGLVGAALWGFAR